MAAASGPIFCAHSEPRAVGSSTVGSAVRRAHRARVAERKDATVGCIKIEDRRWCYEHIAPTGNRAEMLRIRDVGSTTQIGALDRQNRTPIAHVIEFFSRSTNRGDPFRDKFQKMYDEGIQIALKRQSGRALTPAPCQKLPFSRVARDVVRGDRPDHSGRSTPRHPPVHLLVRFCRDRCIKKCECPRPEILVGAGATFCRTAETHFLLADGMNETCSRGWLVGRAGAWRSRRAQTEALSSDKEHRAANAFNAYRRTLDSCKISHRRQITRHERLDRLARLHEGSVNEWNVHKKIWNRNAIEPPSNRRTIVTLLPVSKRPHDQTATHDADDGAYFRKCRPH
jgi:hypothetical protein